MNPIDFEQANKRLFAPENWDEVKYGPCAPLPVLHLSGRNTYLSCWSPSKEELGILNAGGVVLLGVVAAEHPPVSLEAVLADER